MNDGFVKVIDKIREFGLKKNLENPKLVISTKPRSVGNEIFYKEIRVDHEDKKVILDCLKSLHREFDSDIEFLERINLIKNIEYVGHFGEFNCKAFL